MAVIADLELYKLFKAESEEHLSRLDDGLLRLEKTPSDTALLEDLFRESHSLKGAARMLGLINIEAAAHGLESVLNAARKNQAALTPELIEPLNGKLRVLGPLVQEALDGEPKTPAGATLPPSQAAVEAAAPLAATACEALRIETVRVETRKLDELLTQVGELAVIQERSRHRLALMDQLLEQWAGLSHGAALSLHGGAENQGLLGFGRLLKQTRDADFDDNARLESSVNLLEDQVHSMRLLSLSTLFSLFPRMIRELAKEQGKEVELLLEGGDITVDKRILEEMKDPLMHLLRNAVDHGIELPGEREQAAKSRSGTVRLSATRANAGLRLEVQDDGRGLEREAILQQAIKRGLYDEAILLEMTPAQWRQLIFLPGFSTARYVTELSGRGVGLDVVRVNVERMKGSIHVESILGRGLTVQLQLPLNVAAMRILLAKVGGRLYGLPLDFIDSSRRVRESDIFTLEGRPAVLVDGRPVIVARLAELLELPAGTRSKATPDILACIIIQVGDERLGLLAEELLSEEEVAPKPLGAPLRRVRNVSGLAVLGSGEICVVLNPQDLLSSTRNAGVTVRTEESGRCDATAKPVVLLVEDSVLIRAMEKRILEDGGYQVVTAVDGVDALRHLERQAFAAVVSDIMMPNMDGLTLTARIRGEPRYKELPVVLVTTLASDEDKRRGLDAGANAYLPKPSFDQRLLLDTLKRLIAI